MNHIRSQFLAQHNFVNMSANWMIYFFARLGAAGNGNAHVCYHMERDKQLIAAQQPFHE